MVDNIEKELEILWEFMPKECFDSIGKKLLSYGIKETQSKYCVYDLMEFPSEVKKLIIREIKNNESS
jgi:hypothetical protein